MRFNFFLGVSLVSVLAACSAAPKITAPLQITPVATTQTASPAPAPVDPLQQLSQFTVADLNSAEQIAVANKDTLSIPCYPALSKFVQSFPSLTGDGTVSGAVSAFETARTARLKVQGAVGAGLPDYVKLGCAALFVDEQALAAKLAGMAAGASVGAPIVGALH